MENRSIIIFAKSPSERDYLRHLIAEIDLDVLCFDKEDTCFDNLGSINPKLIIARIDSNSVAWRFIIALHVLEADAKLLIISNVLSGSFNRRILGNIVYCVRSNFEKRAILKKIQQIAFDREGLSHIKNHEALIGESVSIKKVNEMLPCLKNSAHPVLITGEMGTGKERLARIIARSRNDQSFFIKIDCSVKNQNVFLIGLRSELKGKEKDIMPSNPQRGGDLTGTILIDRIDSLDEIRQAEILWLLEGGTLSSSQNRKIRLGFIATSETDLGDLVEKNCFRKDLYYRLNVIPIYLEPLRQRQGDIPLLIDYFLLRSCIKDGLSLKFPPKSAIESLLCYNWPENVAELERLIDQYAVTGDDTIIKDYVGAKEPKKNCHDYLCQSFKNDLELSTFEIQQNMSFLGNVSLRSICEKFVGLTEKKIMQRALETTNWNRKKAAALLDISYKSMLNKMKIYEIV